MKKLYTILFATALSIGANAQFGQIENGGFENWTDITLYETPADWVSSNEEEFYGIPTVTQSSDAQDGASSVRIETVLIGSDTLSGYVLHGNLGSSGPDTGIPYTDNFEAVSLQYKSDLPVGDTLYMIYIRYQFGVAIESNVMPVCFGTNAVWTPALLYVGNQPQDELFIGFIGRDPFGADTATPGAWSMIDNIQLISGGSSTTALPNHSFETWETTTTESPDNWYTLNPLLVGAGIENTVKTTDANSGSFAIEMTTAQLDQDTIASFLSNGPIDLGAAVPFSPAPYSATPTTVSGAYKYAPSGADQGFLQIQFFQAGTSVGIHAETFNPQGSYTSFTSPLTITGTPDSVSIIAFSGENTGSVLILDDLSFSGNNVGLAEFSAMEINMFPNPATNRVMIKANGTFNYEIIDLSGNRVETGSNNQSAIEVSIDHLNSGTYFVRISNETSTETHKLIVQ